MVARRVIVLLNGAAGTGARPDAAEIRAALSAVGVDAEVRQVEASELADAARAAADESPDAVVAAGGDGTVSAVAGALAGGRVALGVLPMGTLNHFAKDAGVPLGLEDAARTIAEADARPVDVAEVNGRVFVNNSSLGIYPEIVREREAHRRATGRGKWLAMLVALWRVMRRFPHLVVLVDLKDHVMRCVTPFVFVGNNEYEARLTAPGTRSKLDGGTLSVLTASPKTRLGMARMMIAALLHPSARPTADGLDLASRPEIRVESRHASLPVALDGEVFRLRTPLVYRIRPAALSLLCPSAGRRAA